MYVNILLISLLIICISIDNSLYKNYGIIWKFKNMLMTIFNNKVIIIRYKNYFLFCRKYLIYFFSIWIFTIKNWYIPNHFYLDSWCLICTYIVHFPFLTYYAWIKLKLISLSMYLWKNKSIYFKFCIDKSSIYTIFDQKLYVNLIEI